MKAQLRALHSPDVQDLRSFVPKQSENFSLFVQAMIGLEGDDGEESFDFILCTPTWLQEHITQRGAVLGMHHVIVNQYDYEELLKVVRDFCDRCEGETWRDVAIRLGCLGRWEFEDYQD